MLKVEYKKGVIVFLKNIKNQKFKIIETKETFIQETYKKTTNAYNNDFDIEKDFDFIVVPFSIEHNDYNGFMKFIFKKDIQRIV